MIGERAAGQHGIQLGDDVLVETDGRELTVSIVGVVEQVRTTMLDSAQDAQRRQSSGRPAKRRSPAKRRWGERLSWAISLFLTVVAYQS